MSTRDRADVLAGVDLAELLARLTGREARRGKFPCPNVAHEQTGVTPPVSVTVERRGYGLWKCHGCGAGGTAADALAVARGMSPGDALRDLAGDPSTSPAPVGARRPAAGVLPDEAQVAAWAERAHRTPGLLDRLAERKGWSAGAMAALNVGWDGRRVTFPIHDAAGALVNVVRYVPGGQPKSLAVRGRPRDLFPALELLNGQRVHRADRSTVALADVECVHLVEGEPDAVAAMSVGLLAIAVPGTGCWRTSWAERLAGWHVRVLTDHDEAGRTLSGRLAADVTPYAASIAVLSWPELLERIPEKGFDMSDYACELRSSSDRPPA